jgi:hypothetical protein
MIQPITDVAYLRTHFYQFRERHRKEKSIISCKEYAGLRISIECAFLRRNIFSAIRFFLPTIPRAAKNLRDLSPPPDAAGSE